MDRPQLTTLPSSPDTVPFDRRRLPAIVDDVSLVDVWRVLVRRKTTIGAVVVASLAIGLAYALLTPRLYAYTTIIEIGGRSGGNDFIEPPETVRVKLADGYIEQVLQERLKNNPDETATYQIKAEVPRNSQVVILKSKGSADRESVYVALHNAVVDQLKQDHRRILDVSKRDLEVQLQSRERQGAELRDQAKLLEAQIGRLGDERKLLAKEMDSLQNLIATADRGRERHIQEASTDEARAMTMLMLTDALQRNQGRLVELERRATIGLANDRDALLKQLADNRRARSAEEAQIEGLRLKLSNMRETRAVIPPMRSLTPVGLGKKTMVMLSGVVGLFLGVVAAFLAEFAAKAKTQTREEPVRKTETA